MATNILCYTNDAVDTYWHIAQKLFHFNKIKEFLIFNSRWCCFKFWNSCSAQHSMIKQYIITYSKCAIIFSRSSAWHCEHRAQWMGSVEVKIGIDWCDLLHVLETVRRVPFFNEMVKWLGLFKLQTIEVYHKFTHRKKPKTWKTKQTISHQFISLEWIRYNIHSESNGNGNQHFGM